MAARLDTHILVVFGADLTQLKGGTHLAVEFVLLLRDFDVFLIRVLDGR